MKTHLIASTLLTIVIHGPGFPVLWLWLRRICGDPGRALEARPALPWWARGLVGQVLAFLSLVFLTSNGVSLADRAWDRLGPLTGLPPVPYQLWALLAILACLADLLLAVYLCQKAAAIAYPPHFDSDEKRALKKLNLKGPDPAAAVAGFQDKIKGSFQDPRPITIEGLNFRDPKSGLVLASAPWAQVVCTPKISTNNYIVIHLDGQVDQTALSRLAHGWRANRYRLYFSRRRKLWSGLKMRALARRLWAEAQDPGSAVISGAAARRAISLFD